MVFFCHNKNHTFLMQMRSLPPAVSFSSSSLLYLRLICFLSSGAGFFVRRLAARHHSGLYSEFGQDNGLQ
jgi:hypothetical protein